jgi:hypothetical protein
MPPAHFFLLVVQEFEFDFTGALLLEPHLWLFFFDKV